jgi:RHS repeat-associated protein
MTSATYDGDGLRSSETSTPAGGSPVSQGFVWNTTSSVPELLMDSSNAYIFAGSGTPIEQVNLSNGSLDYLVADSLGSVRGVVSSSGSLLASTDYDAWGNPETAAGLASYTPFGFAGAYTDQTGLVYLIGRYYDPQTGQFLSVDPMVEQTQQAYLYAGDDPVNRSDPNGMFNVGFSKCGQYLPGGPSQCPSSTFGGFSWIGHHWRGIVTTVGIVAGVAAAATGIGAIADVTILGVDMGAASFASSVVASGADLPACIGGSKEACTGAAASLFSGGLGAAASRIGYVNNLLSEAGVELSIGRNIAPRLLSSKAFAVGVGALFWDAFRELAGRVATRHG